MIDISLVLGLINSMNKEVARIDDVEFKPTTLNDFITDEEKEDDKDE